VFNDDYQIYISLIYNATMVIYINIHTDFFRINLITNYIYLGGKYEYD
jgi:hypothetical protein